MRIFRPGDPGYSDCIGGLARSAEPERRVAESVAEILQAVRERGDEALIELTERFDGARLTPEALRVTEGEFVDAERKVDEELRAAVAAAHRNVRTFAEASLRKDWEMVNEQGAMVGERFLPFERVGVYVPGGSAPLVSTALMTVTLGAAAGVPELVVTTPCGRDGTIDPNLLYALRVAGATEVYRIGGAQAIAAMAFGTETIAAAAKVFGPGNSYVVEAKRQCFGRVAIDLLPGPSEILVLADDSADAAWIAADLLAQVEHDPESVAGLATDSLSLLEGVAVEVARQAAGLRRKEIVLRALERAFLVQVTGWEDGIALANAFAPEHLSLVCRDPDAVLPLLRSAGAIFIGGYAPVAAGDFLAGPSHTLPTGGAGKSFAGLTADQFQRRTSVLRFDREALQRSRAVIETFCRVEGLDAHARSAAIRFRASPVEPPEGL